MSDDKLVKVNLAIPMSLKLRVKRWALNAAIDTGNKELTLQQSIERLLNAALLASDDNRAQIAKQEYRESLEEEEKAGRLGSGSAPGPSPRRPSKPKKVKK